MLEPSALTYIYFPILKARKVSLSKTLTWFDFVLRFGSAGCLVADCTFGVGNIFSRAFSRVRSASSPGDCEYQTTYGVIFSSVFIALRYAGVDLLPSERTLLFSTPRSFFFCSSMDGKFLGWSGWRQAPFLFVDGRLRWEVLFSRRSLRVMDFKWSLVLITTWYLDFSFMSSYGRSEPLWDRYVEYYGQLPGRTSLPVD